MNVLWTRYSFFFESQLLRTHNGFRFVKSSYDVICHQQLQLLYTTQKEHKNILTATSIWQEHETGDFVISSIINRFSYSNPTEWINLLKTG